MGRTSLTADQSVSRGARGALRGGPRAVLTDSLLTPGTRPGYDALSRCAELARGPRQGALWSVLQAGRRIEPSAPLRERQRGETATNVPSRGTFVTARPPTAARDVTNV